MTPLDADELRALVREVLRDALPGAVTEAALPTPQVTATVEAVTLTTDAELAAFVQRLLQLAEDPARREAVRAGHHRFRLADPPPPPADEPVATTRAAAEALRVERGAVTERVVREAARSGRRLVVARAAVLTPLARDRAKALGVEVERER